MTVPKHYTRIQVDRSPGCADPAPDAVDPAAVFRKEHLEALKSHGLSARAIENLARLCQIVLRIPDGVRKEPLPNECFDKAQQVAAAVEKLQAALDRDPLWRDGLSQIDETGLGIGLDTLKYSAWDRAKGFESAKRTGGHKTLPFKRYVVKYVAAQLGGEPVRISRSGGASKSAFEQICDTVFETCKFGCYSEKAIRAYLGRPTAPQTRNAMAASDNTHGPIPSRDDLTAAFYKT